MKINKVLKPFAITFLTVVAVSLLYGCKAERVDTQGIVGQVYWIEGNLMPTVTDNGEEIPKKPKREKVKRTLRIYERTHINQATMEGTLFTNIETPLVAEIETEEDGSFVVGLSPGQYSIFTVEEKGYFASVYDLDSFIQPIEVKNGEWTTTEILINYKAAY